MTRPGALESKKTLWGRLPETTYERVFEKMRTRLPDEPEGLRKSLRGAVNGLALRLGP
jgi:hypothetical protein